MNLALLDLEVRLRDPYCIGLPAAMDIDFSPIAHLLGTTRPINVGDPRVPGIYRRTTKPLECVVDDWLTSMFGGSREEWWGYIASGSTSAIKNAVRIARDTLPRKRWHGGPVLYASTAAHSCVEEAARDLCVPLEPIPSRYGRMDIAELAARVWPGRPAILVATQGTTMVEGIDDAERARATLVEMGACSVWVHADAALAGMPRTLDEDAPAGVRLDSGVLDSLSISGHKFPGVDASAWFTIRTRLLADAPVLPYTGDLKNTPEGCRSGHDALRWWWVLKSQGVDGMRERAKLARERAAVLADMLRTVGVDAAHYPHAFTVAFEAPAPHLIERYGLATAPAIGNPRRSISHAITMPGVADAVLDEFVMDMGEYARGRRCDS